MSSKVRERARRRPRTRKPAPRRQRRGPLPNGAGELALGEPVARTGRDRQAAVGIRDGGNRQQRPPDIAVGGATAPSQTSPARKASRRWNSTAVSQRRSIGLGAQPAGSTSNSAPGSRSAAPCRRCAGHRRLPARAGPRATLDRRRGRQDGRHRGRPTTEPSAQPPLRRVHHGRPRTSDGVGLAIKLTARGGRAPARSGRGSDKVRE